MAVEDVMKAEVLWNQWEKEVVKRGMYLFILLMGPH